MNEVTLENILPVMADTSKQDQEKHAIANEANRLLLKLNTKYAALQKLNQEIESRPFSTRIHGQFDHALKKSHSIISKLTSLLKKYHSFDFSQNPNAKSPKCKSDEIISPLPHSFIIDFKDIALKIEREWRIGQKQINNFNSQHKSDGDYYHSDNDVSSYRNNRNRKIKHQRSSSNTRSTSSSPMHTFSNPNALKSTVNIGLSHSQQLQKRKQKTRHSDSDYHAKIGLVPYDAEEKLNSDIRKINDDLQYLLAINQSVNELMQEQQENVDDIEEKVNSSRQNVENGMNTLRSIQKSQVSFALVGGLGLAAFGGPIIAVGAGVKAAVTGAIGLGTVGAFAGSVLASKMNEKMDNENNEEKKERLLNENDDNESEKKEDMNKSFFGFRKDDDDAGDDIDDWDARSDCF